MASKNLIVLSSILLTLASVPGNAKEEPKKEEPKQEAKSKGIRVAILPVVNRSSEEGAAKIMEDILRDRTKEVPSDRATFLQPLDTERLLNSQNEADRMYVISERWAKLGVIDTTAATGLEEILQVDAILLTKVAEWENLRVNVIGQGESNTTVGLQFALYDLRTMKKIWFKDPHEQRFAQEVDASSGSVSYDETGYIQSRKTTDPPRYEDVANDLVRAAFKKFPQK